MTPLQRLAEVPLDPGADEARRWLVRELAKPEYHRDNLIQRAFEWIANLLDRSVGGASAVPGVRGVLSLVVFAVVAVAVIALVSRTRVTRRASRDKSGPALSGEVITADQLRQRAVAAAAEGRHSDALVDGFRALALRAIERGRIDDQPGATAHELAARLAAEFPSLGDAINQCANWFDLVLYGDRVATRAQAEQTLALDLDLVSAR